MNGITKDTFKAFPVDAKLDTLFDYIQDIHVQQNEHPVACNKRFEKLEDKKVRDTVVSSGMGLLGGFVAVAAKLKFWG